MRSRQIRRYLKLVLPRDWPWAYTFSEKSTVLLTLGQQPTVRHSKWGKSDLKLSLCSQEMKTGCSTLLMCLKNMSASEAQRSSGIRFVWVVHTGKRRNTSVLDNGHLRDYKRNFSKSTKKKVPLGYWKWKVSGWIGLYPQECLYHCAIICTCANYFSLLLPT